MSKGIDLKRYYICWTPRFLGEIQSAGFKLAENVDGINENPYYDIVPRINPKTGKPRDKGAWGYVYERTPELMRLITQLSNNK